MSDLGVKYALKAARYEHTASGAIYMPDGTRIDPADVEAVARAIGSSYDGYADPIVTPNNWARAKSAAWDAIAALVERVWRKSSE